MLRAPTLVLNVNTNRLRYDFGNIWKVAFILVIFFSSKNKKVKLLHTFYSVGVPTRPYLHVAALVYRRPPVLISYLSCTSTCVSITGEEV